MKQRIIIIAGIAALTAIGLIAAFAPMLASASPNTQNGVLVTHEFQWIRQGRIGMVRVTGPTVAAVRAVFQDRVFYFYEEDGDFMGLISADFEQDIGLYPMQLWVNYDDGSAEVIDREIEVNYGEFGRSNVTLTARLMPLLEPAVEDGELSQLFNIFKRFTPERYWENGGFIPASTGEQIGFFGTWRLYNETYWRRHTGLDVRMPIGTPVTSAADGRVMLVEELAIRGGYILIDHGWGIYSGYAHLSEKLVVPGQWVRQGDVIGLSGANGRSNGAHLHWEMTSGGTWTHPEYLIDLGLGLNGKTETVRAP